MDSILKTLKKIPGFIAAVIKTGFSYIGRKLKAWVAKKIDGRSASAIFKETATRFLKWLKSLSVRAKAALAAVIVLVICFCSVHSYCASHFLAGTEINGVDVSEMSIAQARKALTENCSSYELKIIGANGASDSIKAADIGLTVTISDNFDDILKWKNGYSWIKAVIKNSDPDTGDTITYNYDERLLEKALSELSSVKSEVEREPKNAELYFNNGEFLIRDAVIGSAVDRNKLEAAVKAAIKEQKRSVDLQSEGVYEMPEVLSNDPVLLAKKASLEPLKNIDITMKFGKASEKINAQTALDWYTVSADGSLKLDTDKLAEYVGIIADKYDTISVPKLFTTHSGETVEIGNSYYGWQLDRDYAVKAIKSYLDQKKSVSIELTDHSEESEKWWIKTAVAYDDLGYYGDTYAEVSIDGQYMWMYQNGEVVFESEVVTGLPDEEHDTPVGIYSIIYKEQNATLRGDGYETVVAYWMVFTYDIGFHDAEWQDAFGDDMYEYNGSHGCVNLPVDAAGELYELVYPGMPVFVY